MNFCNRSKNGHTAVSQLVAKSCCVPGCNSLQGLRQVHFSLALAKEVFGDEAAGLGEGNYTVCEFCALTLFERARALESHNTTQKGRKKMSKKTVVVSTGSTPRCKFDGRACLMSACSVNCSRNSGKPTRQER